MRRSCCAVRDPQIGNCFNGLTKEYGFGLLSDKYKPWNAAHSMLLNCSVKTGVCFGTEPCRSPTLILACIVYWQARGISRIAAAPDFPFDPDPAVACLGSSFRSSYLHQNPRKRLFSSEAALLHHSSTLPFSRPSVRFLLFALRVPWCI